MDDGANNKSATSTTFISTVFYNLAGHKKIFVHENINYYWSNN